MKRNIDTKLVAWQKDKFRKPLIIRGARQTGKTYSVCRFGENHFDIFIKLDFERDRSLHKIFTPKSCKRPVAGYARHRTCSHSELLQMSGNEPYPATGRSRRVRLF
jgi:hypothetical protein